MVAKSYQSYPQIGNSYEKNGRSYIKVQTPSGVREVRWYSNAQYEKMYGVKINEIDDARRRFGFFPDDTLYIAKGPHNTLTQFFEEETHHFGRYCKVWGWYVGVWAKSYDKETLQRYKQRMKELNIHFYCLNYKTISDEKGNILPWEKINGKF